LAVIISDLDLLRPGIGILRSIHLRRRRAAAITEMNKRRTFTQLIARETRHTHDEVG
jgi:hypothetical protein